jgi:serine/threonine protein kinase
MSELIKRRKKLSEPEARYYLAQIVESLQYLHRHLVIHRDLKLGNLFIDSNMCIKVGDFGLATALSHPDERRKTICGTPNYIAPEILEGKTGHSFEVDIWSTGVILYTLLVGKPPFESKDVKSTYKRILANSYAFPEHTPVSADAKSLIRKMLMVSVVATTFLVFVYLTRAPAMLAGTTRAASESEADRSTSLVHASHLVHAQHTARVRPARVPPAGADERLRAVQRRLQLQGGGLTGELLRG